MCKYKKLKLNFLRDLIFEKTEFQSSWKERVQGYLFTYTICTQMQSVHKYITVFPRNLIFPIGN